MSLAAPENEGAVIVATETIVVEEEVLVEEHCSGNGNDYGTAGHGGILGPCIEGIGSIRDEQGELLTMPFSHVCRLLLPVLDNCGPALSIVKSNIGSNLSKLEDRYCSDPLNCNSLRALVHAEVEAETAKASSSCTNALLWVTRSMDFLVELFHNLLDHPDWSMSHACIMSYKNTLKAWHGWLSSSSFMVALNAVPERKKFVEILCGSNGNEADMLRFCKAFTPFLEENHCLLDSVGFDKLKFPV